LLGVTLNFIVIACPFSGTHVVFEQLYGTLTALGSGALSLGLALVLFASYVSIGIILPAIVLQRFQSGHWYAAPVELLIAGAVTLLSLGAILLLIASAVLFWADLDQGYPLAQSPEADLADTLEAQRLRAKGGVSCPIDGRPLAEDEISRGACRQ
jgi:hypothetical protein